MKLAIASEQDFKHMWRIFRMLQRLEWVESEREEERCKAIILGSLEKLGTGGFTRVVMGCETLIDNCCDKSLDHYDFSPRLKQAMQLLEEHEKQEAA